MTEPVEAFHDVAADTGAIPAPTGAAPRRRRRPVLAALVAVACVAGTWSAVDVLDDRGTGPGRVAGAAGPIGGPGPASSSSASSALGRTGVDFVREIEAAAGAAGVAFSPDGRLLATADDIAKTARLWATGTGTLVATLPAECGDGGAGDVLGVRFSPDGSRLVLDCRASASTLYDVATHRRIGTIPHAHRSEELMVISADWRYLVTTLPDTPERWDLGADGQLLHEPRRQGGHQLWNLGAPGTPGAPVPVAADAVVLLPAGGSPLAMTQDGAHRLLLLDPRTRRPVQTLAGHTDRVTAHALTPDGKVLATGAGAGDGTVRLWDLARRRLTATLPGHQGDVRGLEFSTDGRLLASWADDHVLRLWNVATHALLGTIPNVEAASLGPDGRLLLTTAVDGGPTGLWRVDGHAGPQLLRSELPAAVFSPDGHWLAGVSGRVTLWRLTTT